MKVLPQFYVVFLLFIFQSCTSPAQEDVASLSPIEVNVDEASAIIANENTMLLDVRTAAEVKDGYIAGATHIDILKWEEFTDQVEKLDKSEPVMVYCKVGGRSAKAAAHLVETGFIKVYDIKGGILAWKKADKPIKKD